MRLAYRLAALCGERHVEALQASLTPEEMDGWEAYDMLESLSDRRLRFLLANMASAICASNGKEISPDVFLAKWERPQRRQTIEEQTAVLDRVAGVA